MESWNGRVPDQELVRQRVCIPQDLTIHSNRFPWNIGIIRIKIESIFSAKTWQAWRPHKTTRRPQASIQTIKNAEKLDPRDQGPPSLRGLLHLKNQENTKAIQRRQNTPNMYPKEYIPQFLCQALFLCVPSWRPLCACRTGLFCHAKQVISVYLKDKQLNHRQ